MADSNDETDGGSPHPFLSPISGLMAVVFAVMAGATLSGALSGGIADLLVPVVLAAASLGAILLKRRLDADVTTDGMDGTDETD